VTGLEPVQVPFWQLSVWVQALPSLHAVQIGRAACRDRAVVALQVPATWHWSSALQVTGLEPVQVPFWQLSVWVQALPSLHAVPLLAFGFEHTPVVVLRVRAKWHWASALQVTGLEPVQVPFWQLSVWVQALPSLHAV